MIDTAKVPEYRRLQFKNVDECMAEIDRIVTAENSGKLRRTGNWSAGQILNHIASWINYSYEGFPMKVPWFIRMIIKREVPTYIRDGMPRGVHIPRTPGGTHATEDMPLDQAADKLRKALKRLKTEPARFDSPGFGKVTEEQRVAMTLRHAELHMGYLHP
jgi:hypothetical protein